MLIPQYDNAIQLAMAAHRSQTRKGSNIPFLVHPISVGITLAMIGVTNNVIIGGILHDTIEDTRITYDDIKGAFGREIADLVMEVTTEKETAGEPWITRRLRTINSISTISQDAISIKAVDLYHNMASLVRDHALMGDKLFEHFSSTKNNEHWAFSQVYHALKKRVTSKEEMVLEAIRQFIEKVFGSVYEETSVHPD